MPDTGTRSPQTQSGFFLWGANVIDGNDSNFGGALGFVSAGGVLVYEVSNFAGTDIPVGSTINGVKLRVRVRKVAGIWADTKISSVVVSLDGASGTFSSNIGEESLSTTVTDEFFGGETEDWGLDWSDWTDVSNLAFKITQAPEDAVGNTLCWVHEIDAIIYYTEGEETATNNSVFFGTNF